MTRTKQIARRSDPTESRGKKEVIFAKPKKMLEKLGVGTGHPLSPIKKISVTVTVPRGEKKKKETKNGKEEEEKGAKDGGEPEEKKKNRISASRRSISNIRKMQKNSNLIFAKAPMERLIRSTFDDIGKEQFGRKPGYYRIGSTAIEWLRHASEHFLLTNVIQLPLKLQEIMNSKSGNWTIKSFIGYILTNDDVKRALGPAYIRDLENRTKDDDWKTKVNKKNREMDRKKKDNDVRLDVYKKKEENKMKREKEKMEKEDLEMEKEKKDREKEKERKKKKPEKESETRKKSNPSSSSSSPSKRKEMDDDRQGEDKKSKKTPYEKVRKVTTKDGDGNRKSNKKKDYKKKPKLDSDSDDDQIYTKKSEKRSSSEKKGKHVKRSSYKSFSPSSSSESD